MPSCLNPLAKTSSQFCCHLFTPTGTKFLPECPVLSQSDLPPPVLPLAPVYGVGYLTSTIKPTKFGTVHGPSDTSSSLESTFHTGTLENLITQTLRPRVRKKESKLARSCQARAESLDAPTPSSLLLHFENQLRQSISLINSYGIRTRSPVPPVG